MPWMEVPEPTTIRRLWTYLHEAVHMHSAISPSLEGNNYSSSEAEAELGALRILESEGLKLSLRVLKATRRRIEFEVRKDFKEFGAKRSPIETIATKLPPEKPFSSARWRFMMISIAKTEGKKVGSGSFQSRTL